MVENLAARYAAFPSSHKIQFTAQINLVGAERISSLLDTKTNFQNGILNFSAPGYQGYINEKAGFGYLELSSAYPIEDIDYFLRVALALVAHNADCILMHTAGIIRNERAYLFFGHSGSGKTTICQSSLNSSSLGALKILNDDLILLQPHGDIWLAHGTPFWNPTQIAEPSNQYAPIAGLYYLIQDKQVFTQKLSKSKAIAALLSNIPVIPQDSVRSIHLLNLLNRIQNDAPVCELHFLPDDSFWNVIQE
ncbi:MAG: hypothetical protein ACK2TU_00440 [Anaerolineales bacterium]